MTAGTINPAETFVVSSKASSAGSDDSTSASENTSSAGVSDGKLLLKADQKEDVVTAEKKQDKKEIYIDGIVYDITGFVNKHPGGRIIEFVVDTDATDAFTQFHMRSARANKTLKALPQRKIQTVRPDGTKDEEAIAELAKFTQVGDESDSNLTRDIRALTVDLIKEGWFNPDPIHAVWRCLEIVFMYALGMAMMFYSSPAGWGKLLAMTVNFMNIDVTMLSMIPEVFLSYAIRPLTFVAGLVILGIAQGRCGWLQHECGHCSFTGYIPLDRRLQEFIYGFGTGMSGAWWRNQHNKHHAAPQKVGRDVDLDTLPLIAFSIDSVISDLANTKGGYAKWLVTGTMGRSAKKKYEQLRDIARGFLANQKNLFAPVICPLVAFFWQLYLHPRHAFRTGNYIELVWMLARYVSCYIFLCGNPETGVLPWALNLPFYQAYAIYCVFVSIGAGYIFTNFAVSHTHLDTVPNDEHRTWARYSYEHTMNCTNHWMTNWWMAFLNFQIEHHLFPSMPQYRFAKLSPRIREIMEKNGKPYKCMNYWDAISITMKNLNAVAEEALEMTEVDVEKFKAKVQ